MTSRRSTACFARSTRALATAALLAAIAAVAVRGERPARACSGGDPTISDATTFDPLVIGDPTLSPGVFYEPWLGGFGGYQPLVDGDQLLADWHGYLKDTGVTDADWKQVLYTAPAADLAALRARVTGRSTAIPKGYEHSSLWAQPSARDRVDGALGFVEVARGLEPSSATSDPDMGTPPARPLPTAKLLAAANAGIAAHAGDPFLAQRYAFQAARALFYQQDFSGVVAFVDRQTSVLAGPSPSLHWRARYYLAGALRRTNAIARQSYELARIHANYPPLAGAAAGDFKPNDDADWRRSLDLARTVREKTELWRLVGVKDDGLAAIREIVKLDPRSDLLAVLVLRELARAESAGGAEYPGMVADPAIAAKIKAADATLEPIVVDLANRAGVDRKWLLDLVAGHLAALRGDVATTRARLKSALSARPGDVRVADQARASLSLALVRAWTIDGSHETELGRAMTSLSAGFGRASTTEQEVRWGLAPIYLKAGRLVDAEYLVPGSVDGANLTGRYEGHSGTLRWAQVGFIREMISRLDRTTTDFDRFVLHQTAFTRPALEQELALRYLLDGDFTTAQQTFATTAALSQPLHTDPFVIHIRDCHDCDHGTYANAAWTHASFTKKMAELAVKAHGSDDAAAQASMELGIGYYNLSWYGNARSILGDDTHQDTHEVKAALKWFQHAFELAKNRELKAKAAYYAAKAEVGDILDVPIPVGGGGPPIEPVPNTWFGKLQTLKDTQYYKDVLAECGTFTAWVAAQKH